MSLNDLPFELLVIVFDQLSIINKLKCRLVNKKCRFVIDNFLKLDNLVISKTKLPCFSFRPFPYPYLLIDKKWYWANKLVELQNHIIAKKDASISSMVKMKMFENLKELYLNINEFGLNSKHTLEALSNFKELTILKLSFYGNKDEEHTRGPIPAFKINLPKIKVIEVHVKNFHLILNAPNLDKIHCLYLCDITLIHPETVKEIHMKLPSSKILELINLEFVYLWLMDSKENEPALKLPKLKELHFCSNIKFGSRELSKENLIIFLKKVRQIANNENLKVNFIGYYLNENLEDAYYLSYQYRFGTDKDVKAYLKNQQYLSEKFPFVNLILKNLDTYIERIPKGFFSKFYDLKYLVLESKLVKEENFSNLLDDFHCLEEINLKNCSYSEKFYTKILAKKCPFLTRLCIGLAKDSRKLDLNFLLLFEYLERIALNKFINPNLLSSLFRKLSFLKLYEFFYKNSSSYKDIPDPDDTDDYYEPETKKNFYIEKTNDGYHFAENARRFGRPKRSGYESIYFGGLKSLISYLLELKKEKYLPIKLEDSGPEPEPPEPFTYLGD